MASTTNKDSIKKLKRSTDELTNKDTHKLKAVAVKYDTNKDKAPKIIATGKGSIAAEILKIAEDNNVPLYEDPTLADLLAKLELDSQIPGELYVLVEEVLSFVYQLDKMAKKKAALRKKFAK
jgi:flagellar biosynthesis protein